MKRTTNYIITILMIILLIGCDKIFKEELLSQTMQSTADERLQEDSIYSNIGDSNKEDTSSDNANTNYNSETSPISGNRVNISVIMNLINKVRAEGFNCDGIDYPPVKPLYWSTKLEKVALKHSQDMNSNNFFSHTSANGNTLSDRIEEEGYHYQMAAENIADGYSSEREVVEAWLNSQTHCKNIMRKDFTETGIGRSGDYWTQVFCKPRN